MEKAKALKTLIKSSKFQTVVLFSSIFRKLSDFNALRKQIVDSRSAGIKSTFRVASLQRKLSAFLIPTDHLKRVFIGQLSSWFDKVLLAFSTMTDFDQL